MATKSIYLPCPSIDNGLVRVTDEEHRHLSVARAELGEAVEIFDGSGRVWSGLVAELSKKHTTVRVDAERRFAGPRHQVILAQALIRTGAFELALEKAVEVGVTRIVPFVAARSNGGVPSRTERWRRIIVEAAKQSKQFCLPVLDPVAKFSDLLGLEARTRIVLSERGGGSLRAALSGSPVLYLVGPEGGWTDAEMKSAEQAGFRDVSLGTGILKSETASVIGAALIRYELGEM